MVNRVYDVSSKIAITSAQQQLLAGIFKQEDAINNLYIGNANSFAIDSVKANYKSAFHQLLTSPLVNEYYSKCNATKVNANARLMAAMLQRKYNSSATMQLYFNQIFSW